VRGQKHQMNALWDSQFWRDVPAGLVQHQHNLLAQTSTCCLCKGFEHHIHGRNVDTGTNPGVGSSSDRMHKAVDVLPDMTRLNQRDWTLATWRPDPSHNRKQPNTCFVLAPRFDTCIWVGGLDLSKRVVQFFFQASCWSGVAAWR
jgi:hypothetical protein